jgi:hypothetical protein
LTRNIKHVTDRFVFCTKAYYTLGKLHTQKQAHRQRPRAEK